MKPYEPEQLPPKDLDLPALIPIVGKANRAIATLEGCSTASPIPTSRFPHYHAGSRPSSKIEAPRDFEDVLKFEAGEPLPKRPPRRHLRSSIILPWASENFFKSDRSASTPSSASRGARGQRSRHDKTRGRFRTIQTGLASLAPQSRRLSSSPFALLAGHLNRLEAYWHTDADLHSTGRRSRPV
jgi:hypothetical protein